MPTPVVQQVIAESSVGDSPIGQVSRNYMTQGILLFIVLYMIMSCILTSQVRDAKMQGENGIP